MYFLSISFYHEIIESKIILLQWRFPQFKPDEERIRMLFEMRLDLNNIYPIKIEREKLIEGHDTITFKFSNYQKFIENVDVIMKEYTSLYGELVPDTRSIVLSSVPLQVYSVKNVKEDFAYVPNPKYGPYQISLSNKKKIPKTLIKEDIFQVFVTEQC